MLAAAPVRRCTRLVGPALRGVNEACRVGRIFFPPQSEPMKMVRCLEDEAVILTASCGYTSHRRCRGKYPVYVQDLPFSRVTTIQRVTQEVEEDAN